MKNALLWTQVCFLISTVIPAASHAQSFSGGATTRNEIRLPKSIYTPKGFDSNDNVQIVVSGVFTGYCMKLGATGQKIDTKDKKIFISQAVSVTGSCSDLAMYIPYSSVVSLGQLPSGTYDVFASNSEKKFEKMATLPVAEAKISTPGSTDEHYYAPVSEIKFTMNPGMSDPELTLSGVLTNTCLNLGDIEVRQTSKNVVEVLPQVNLGKDNCKLSQTQFSKTVVLKSFPAGDTLIHVRSMNGQSFNKVVTQLDRL